MNQNTTVGSRVLEVFAYDATKGIFLKQRISNEPRDVAFNDTKNAVTPPPPPPPQVLSSEPKPKVKALEVTTKNQKQKGIQAFFSSSGSSKPKNKNVKQDKKHDRSNKKSKTTPKETISNLDSDDNENVVESDKSGRRGRKRVNYSIFYNNDVDVSDDSVEEKKSTPVSSKRVKLGNARSRTSRKDSHSKKTKKSGKDLSEDEFSIGDEDTDEDSMDEDFASVDKEDELDDFIEISDDDFVAKPKPKKSAVRPKKQLGKSVPAAKDSAATAKNSKDPEKKSMAESFAPINTPIYSKLSMDEIAKTKQFLDPCGMEATDDIIDQLIGEQVDKIGGLLLRSIGKHDSDADQIMDSVRGLGSKENLLKLGTACSGTDAPALALILIQEQMELRGLRKEENKRLEFEHEFSCEVDPFKQAYLARNFDSILYPDIAKLTDKPGPVDVYGQTKELPAFNMFVAGTSCKNFSMLRSNKRIDIEDKGCSGETFMAATEVLFDKKPKLAIFENVTGAPWEKMSEYITGRVKLSSCDEKKQITNINKHKNVKELIFAFDEELGAIVVDRVPGFYGVRVGSPVKGFLQQGSKQLKQIVWPKAISMKKTCTLNELMKYNGIKKASDTLVLETPCTYCTHTVRVDTKDYGLPQTRNRTYMLVWQPDDDDVHDDLGFYWEAIVRYLKSPVRHSLEAFILNDDHEIIRRFREALNGPAGRRTKSACMQEVDFWASNNANLPHNKNSRAALGLKDRARYLTNWGPYGEKQIPPHYWLEYINCCNQRQVDMLDILHASALRDAESHDSNFTSFYWNISQNVTKEKHRTATSGIAGCVTPGGDVLLPHKGRPILGCEKLLLQGLPYFRLALQNETEVQLGDLAGNAMSLTVVSACMLGSILAEQARQEMGLKKLKPDSTEKERRDFADMIYDKFHRINPHLRNDAKSNVRVQDNCILPEMKTCATKLFRDLANLADEAIDSSVLCTCESSGRNSRTQEFVQCETCRVTCCRNCLSDNAGYNLSSHKTSEFSVTREKHDSGRFQTKLRSLLPASLYLTATGLGEIESIGHRYSKNIISFADCPFNLHRIKRDKRKWIISYYARNNDVGEAVGELRITVGDIKTVDIVSEQQANLGVSVILTSFLLARSDSPTFGALPPTATLCVKKDDVGNTEPCWISKAPSRKGSLHVVGEGVSESPRISVGLVDSVEQDLKAAATKSHNLKFFNSARERNEERRWIYTKNWDKWPKVITIESEDCDSLSGTYERASCEQTVNMNALWIRHRTDNAPTLYLLIEPNVSRTGPDNAIITSSISYQSQYVIAKFPHYWQPCDAFDERKFTVNHVEFHEWKEVNSMKCEALYTSVQVNSNKCLETDVLMTVQGLTDRQCNMLCQRLESKETVLKLPVHSGQRAQQIIRVFNSVCVSAIQQHVASSGLHFGLLPDDDGWHELKKQDPNKPFGTCEECVPQRPVEHWVFDKERERWDRKYESGASRKFRLALQGAPTPFEIWLNREQRLLNIKFFPYVAAHYVGRQLIDGRDVDAGDVSVKFRFTDTYLQDDPIIDPFKVKTCRDEATTDIELKKPYSLYDRQKRVITKMLNIERGVTQFEELEMVENPLYGSSGLNVTTIAERVSKLGGGVIADAIGAGKTVVSIGLILNGLKEARANKMFPRRTSATLVVVPPALLHQWKLEIDKFSPTTLNVTVIYDFSTLQNLAIKNILDSDVVIVPIDILESKGYFENLAKKANLNKSYKEKLPRLPTHSGQKEINDARGVWIPATSADPYAGSNNSTNQQNRNASAFYTHVYQEAIRNIRNNDVFKESDRAVPLEFFEWERVIVDEIHESLCTTKSEIDDARERDGKDFFKEKNRRAGREFLGITIKNVTKRPLVYRKAIFGLSGTPLLDSSSRVIELANLMGNAYVFGLSSHWRRLEKESSRDIFLENYLEPVKGREARTAEFNKCQDYLDVACCRNKVDDEEMNGCVLQTHIRRVRISMEEKRLYLDSMKGIPEDKRSLSIRPEDFEDVSPGSFAKFLKQNASLKSRGEELVRICKKILHEDPKTKIIVFTDGSIDAGLTASSILNSEKDLGCTSLLPTDSNEVKNKKISWYQHGDVTVEDKARPRILVLHFEHCAGLNLQTECNNLVLFGPLYTGTGGTNSDPVADASSELQAIGRVYRAGQPKMTVHTFKIIAEGPEGEELLDGQILRRNTNEETIAMATNAAE